MKEEWVERRQQSAIKEFNAVKQELLERQKRAGPEELQVIAGMLYLIENGIQMASAEHAPLPRWIWGLVLGLANPFTGTGYRKFLATLKKFDSEEIANTPEEVITALADWRGDPDVGLFALKALRHADELCRIISAEYVKDLQAAVNELAGAQADPSWEPANYELARRWEKLPDAIGFSNVACQLLSSGPKSPEVEGALECAEAIRDSLSWAQTYLTMQRDSARQAKGAAKAKGLDVPALGRDLYHNRIRQEISAEKGDFVVIDVLSGDYETGSLESEARTRLRERRPDAVTWLERVGYPTPYKMAERVVTRSR